MVSKSMTSEFHLMIAKSWSFRCAATDSWSRGQSFLTGSPTPGRSRGTFFNYQQYFSRFYKCISLDFRSVFLVLCSLYQRCISASLCLDRVADSWRSLIVTWIMLGLAQTDSRVHGSFSQRCYILFVVVSAQYQRKTILSTDQLYFFYFVNCILPPVPTVFFLLKQRWPVALFVVFFTKF